MTEEQDKVSHHWVYIGKRLSTKKTLLDCWVPYGVFDSEKPDQGLRAFAMRASANLIVGGIYNVQTTDDDNTLFGVPQWSGDSLPRETKMELNALDTATRIEHQRLRNEKNEAQKDELDRALKPLLRLAMKSRTRFERDALIATVLRRMMDAW